MNCDTQLSIIYLLSSMQNLITLRLDQHNYIPWFFQMENLLQSLDLMGYIDGTYSSPPQFLVTDDGISTEVTSEFKEWNKVDKAVLSFISATVSSEALEYFVGSRSSREAWLNLRNRYSASSRFEVMHLKTILHTLQKNDDSIDKYLQRIKHTRDELAFVGVPFTDEDIIILSLNGLTPEYNNIKVVIRSMHKSLSMHEFRSQLLAVEKDYEKTMLHQTQSPMYAMTADIEHSVQRLPESSSDVENWYYNSTYSNHTNQNGELSSNWKFSKELEPYIDTSDQLSVLPVCSTVTNCLGTHIGVSPAVVERGEHSVIINEQADVNEQADAQLQSTREVTGIVLKKQSDPTCVEIKSLDDAKFSLLHNQQAADEELLSFKYGLLSQVVASTPLKSFLEKPKRLQIILLVVVLFGAFMVIGDGLFTSAAPTISVSRLQVTVEKLTNAKFLLLACVFLVGLIALQHCRTHRLAFVFAVIVIIWLMLILSVGLYNTVHWNPAITHVLSSHYIIKFFSATGKDGWISLGGILLCVTDTEAMFANLGNFDGTTLVGEKKIVIVSMFKEFSGVEYDKFMDLSQELCSDYEFGYIIDAKHLSYGDSFVTAETLADFQNFNIVKGAGISSLVGDLEANQDVIHGCVDEITFQDFCVYSYFPQLNLFDEFPSTDSAMDSTMDRVILHCAFGDLIDVYLSYHKWKDKGIKPLVNALKVLISLLEVLEQFIFRIILSENDLKDEGAIMISKVLAAILGQSIQVDLSSSYIERVENKHLVQAVVKSEFKLLSVYNKFISDKGVDEIVDMFKTFPPHLQLLKNAEVYTSPSASAVFNTYCSNLSLLTPTEIEGRC